MTINRRLMLAAALLACSAGLSAVPSVTPAAAAKSGVPPYCVLTGGRWGPGSVPQICRFYDYQHCLEAAAALRGNCVINIDYRGVLPVPPSARWRR
jgi:hypothetical protein